MTCSMTSCRGIKQWPRFLQAEILALQRLAPVFQEQAGQVFPSVWMAAVLYISLAVQTRYCTMTLFTGLTSCRIRKTALMHSFAWGLTKPSNFC